MSSQSSTRPAWWTRQYLGDYVLSEEEAWRIINGPPWKCVIAWVTKNGEPVACEMAYAVIDGKIMLTSTANRDKVRALRRNPAISICFQGGSLKQVTVRGKAELRHDPDLVRRWADITVERMTGLDAEQKRREVERYLSPDRLVIVVEVEKIRSFDGERMFRAETPGEASNP